jgi:lipid-binding SYLF domain-containing protein
MILCFELTMPGANSWNGKWSGQDKKYYLFMSGVSKKKMEELNGKYFSYSFGDGWRAGVSVEMIDGVEKRKRAKISAGFYGYNWMADSIRLYGEILTKDQIRDRLKEKRNENL